MIVYKVVGKGTRHCSNWCIYERKRLLSRKEFLKKHPKVKPYLPRYLKGTTVKSVPDTPGIMTFNNIFNAKKFQISNHIPDTIIIKVRGINEKRKSVIVCSAGANPLRLCYLLSSSSDYMSAACGTKFFESVEVLE